MSNRITVGLDGTDPGSTAADRAQYGPFDVPLADRRTCPLVVVRGWSLPPVCDTALVVVGRRTGRSALGPRTGPITHAAMHHATPPVAVVAHD
ncbi:MULTISPECIES: hypothetical protein [unclassified Streptomyces]|uniref:hypothetical protein n=1 Tax=unclassified Streptomyces TaxID=2593676 RepID=UPI00352DCA86